MKTIIKVLFFCLPALLLVSSCEKEDNSPDKLIVTMGAQANTTIGAFYSIGQNKVFTQDLAAANQDTINLLCFYEHDTVNNYINDICLASPGSGIRGVFTGETSTENWAVKQLTTFTAPATEITVAQFDALEQNDAVIPSYYNSTQTSGIKKAKLLKAGDIYAIKTHDNIYGLFKVITVVEGADGYVEFELKLKK
ncbi:MAG TPA: hypothetical protein DCQ26_05935 [Marinilabiliales bacterium]|nr:MAG: hypothetical protein A2W95_01870 [Bacteroidetes bacterium GWA2_40_14]OFX61914.1 MAG: hypothetical protein A2W84_13055 [Bacteroidetes bacterium GWC2_40_13]OFX74061.1 MAG: hypothetical protein A2W96_12165 [Bacteroidetes bacterium GWD2_40_43]OFX93105.1 MAG: hypothetical protein A2W97_05910 [Bacteroidetes bacterium GWE2_40_63]OFY21475.1 MAG: hypothetical protein A2W88_09910 [Bacteroidetes bacterium GWF2_40_13]OFZ24131.1 MAG: hypothetical protein A2437_17045 [Bacteroidetes bacterium RIFOXYC